MNVQIEAVSEAAPGLKWKAIFDRHWHAYSRWFLQKGTGSRASYLDGLRAIKEHMPELVRPYQHICEVAGGGDLEARFLSMWCPPAYVGGCSQLVAGDPNPCLIRNYDYSPELFEGTWLNSKFTGKPVMAVVDCLWGALDGINADGLAVSLAFGGRTEVGTGFGIPIVLRYLLECASKTSEAVDLLRRLPIHMSYSISLVDGAGSTALVYVAPDKAAEVVEKVIATNHQHQVEWPRHAAATFSVEREKTLQTAVEAGLSRSQMLKIFLTSPLLQNKYDKGYGTLYTSIYDPIERSAQLVWPGKTWKQTFDDWQDDTLTIKYNTRR